VLIRCLLAAAVSLAAAGCGPARSVEPRSEDRFELKHDERGRVVRLDKTTGEMAIVSGDRLIPIKSNAGDRNTRAPRQTASAEESPKNPPDEQPPTKSSSAPALRAAMESMIGRQTNLQAEAPVFITATATQTPLTVLPAGSTVRVIGIEADRYLVEFDDRQWGRRAGFVAGSAISTRTHNTSRPPASAKPSERSVSTPSEP
jgi:hypothetical protein